MPYFSTSLNPGVVFLVPAIVPFHPLSFAASRNLRDLSSAPLNTLEGRRTQRRSHYILLGYSRRLVHLGVAVLLYLGLWQLSSWCLEEQLILQALTILPYLISSASLAQNEVTYVHPA